MTDRWQRARVLPAPPGYVCHVPPGFELWVEVGGHERPCAEKPGAPLERPPASVVYRPVDGEVRYVGDPTRPRGWYRTHYVDRNEQPIYLDADLVELIGEHPEGAFRDHVEPVAWRGVAA